jgi:hypothetical protein
MSKLIRLAAAVLCVGLLALGVVLFDPACPLTYPPRRDSGTRPSMAEEVARNEELDQREAAIRHRREAKRQVAQEVIARRRSLAEAIEQFRALDREWPENHSGPRTPEDFGMSQDEWDGRAVLDQVRGSWPAAPTRRPRSPIVWRRSSNYSWPTGRRTRPRRRSREPSGVVEAKQGVSATEVPHARPADLPLVEPASPLSFLSLAPRSAVGPDCRPAHQRRTAFVRPYRLTSPFRLLLPEGSSC